ncbi:MAG TPA: DUF4279 domain-containing protein [Blastocatellia bacterium]|nr:DUF4279 domain-containing protein [Blastocatellia bacterium]
MAISDLHASHIKRVEVNFGIFGQGLNPGEVTQAIGIQPDGSGLSGDDKTNYLGQVIGTHPEGFWILSTESKVKSKDINDHLRYLLTQLLPHRAAVLRFAHGGETYFDIVWGSTYLYAGTGPVIERDCLRGVAELEAGMGFDIYQIEEEEGAT